MGHNVQVASLLGKFRSGDRDATPAPRDSGRAASGPSKPLLAVGVLLCMIAWAYLVYSTISFANSARQGESRAWVYFALAALGAVTCLFLGLSLGYRLLKSLSASRAEEGEDDWDDELEDPFTAPAPPSDTDVTTRRTEPPVSAPVPPPIDTELPSAPGVPVPPPPATAAATGTSEGEESLESIRAAFGLPPRVEEAQPQPQDDWTGQDDDWREQTAIRPAIPVVDPATYDDTAAHSAVPDLPVPPAPAPAVPAETPTWDPLAAEAPTGSHSLPSFEEDEPIAYQPPPRHALGGQPSLAPDLLGPDVAADRDALGSHAAPEVDEQPAAEADTGYVGRRIKR